MARILCVLSQVLGNRTQSDQLRQSLGRIPGLELISLTFGGEDYRKYPVPRVLRYSNTLEADAVLKRKIAAEGVPEHDAVIFNGIGIAMRMLPRMPGTPAAVATDTTPALLVDQQLALGAHGLRRVLLRLSRIKQTRDLRRIAGRVRVFLPMSACCRDSLVRDYGVPPENCEIASSPVAPAGHRSRRGPGPFRLLFVGNDFLRKGGDVTLEAFERGLKSSCRLTIVSNDPVLKDWRLPPGVDWISGLRSSAQVAPLYAEHDLLLMPTRLDQFPQVLGEAAAAGVPAVATDVGGIRELVRDGETGTLLSYGAGAQELAAAVERFIRDENYHARCAEGAFQMARNELSVERFDALMRRVLERLLV